MDLTPIEPKTRSDAWGADLPDKLQWDCYDLAKALHWPAEVLDRLEALGVERLPTRASWYRFLTRMRKADAARRIEKIAQSVAEAQAVANGHGIRDDVFVETLKALAIDKALTGEVDSASRLASAAASIRGGAQRERELELRDAAQKTKDEQLRLAREKFEAAERRENAARNALGDTKLTDAAKIAKMKEIFG